LGVKKTTISLKSPKSEFRFQNQYDHTDFGTTQINYYLIYPSIGNFTWHKKIYTFGDQKGENKPSESKNGIWGQKSKINFPTKAKKNRNFKKCTLKKFWSDSKEKNKLAILK
jgi:hypothetical protein